MKVMLSTIDNPYDPFEDFKNWYLYDVQHGYNSAAYLARIAKTSDQFTEIENAIEENALNIAFGDFEYDEKKGLEIAKLIVKTLKNYGFEINWGESVDEIIEIENFNWKKQFDGKEYSMDGALEDFIRLNSEENEQ